MYTSSADHTIRAWDTERSDGGATTDGGPEERKTRKVYYGHSGIVNVLAWSQAFGILFSGSADFTVKAWRDGVNITTYSGHQASVTALEVTNSGQLFSGSNDETIRCWDVRTGACTYVIKVKGATVNGLLCTPEGLLAWTSDFFVSHFNAKSGKRVRSYEGHTGKILQWRLDPAQAYLYTASADGTVRRWNLRRGHCAAIFRGHKDLVHSILIASTAGQLYSGSSDTTTLIWDIPPDQAAGGGPSEDGSDDSEYDDFGMPLPHHSRPKRTSTERDRRISSERDRRVSSERDRTAADTARAPASQAAASSSSGPSRVETWMDFLSSTTSTSPSALTGKDASGKKDKKEKKEKKDKGKDKGTVSATPSPVSKVGSSI
jgi:WD40 repeat protein